MPAHPDGEGRLLLPSRPIEIKPVFDIPEKPGAFMHTFSPRPADQPKEFTISGELTEYGMRFFRDALGEMETRLTVSFTAPQTTTQWFVHQPGGSGRRAARRAHKRKLKKAQARRG